MAYPFEPRSNRGGLTGKRKTENALGKDNRKERHTRINRKTCRKRSIPETASK